MAWIKLGALLLAFEILDTIASGYNGCKTKDWTYHGHTHTCFRLFRHYYTWERAKKYCDGFWGGPNYKSNAHLAKIDDDATNTFVKAVMTKAKSTYAWIGLNDKAKRGELRWDGFPDEDPKFVQLKDEYFPYTTYTYIQNDSWKRSTSTNRAYVICQHDAENSKAKASCPAIRKKSKLSQPISCQFSFTNWEKVMWRRNSIDVAECRKEADSCQVYQNGYSAKTQSESTTLSYSDVITQPQEVSIWYCSIYLEGDTLLDTAMCKLEVYEPPEDVTCQHVLNKAFLYVSCKTKRIDPEASCKWSYKNQDDFDFTMVTAGESNSVHTPIWEGNDKLFESECYMNLTSEGTHFKVGLVKIKVVMYPTTQNDLSTVQGAFIEKTEEVSLELPSKLPVFILGSSTVQETVSVVQGEYLLLKCEVKGGKPSVHSTTLKCEFPITKREKYENTWRGTTYKLKANASSSWHGKSCSCWGNHLTGQTDKTTVKFNVLYSAKVVSFNVNPATHSQFSFSLNQEVTLQCTSSGNPMPKVTILKHGRTGTKDTELKTVEDSVYVEHSFTAQCRDNAKFLCHAQNVIKDNDHKVSEELDIHVFCPMTLCEGQEDNPGFVARFDEEFVVKLCAVAYPVDSIAKLHLQKKNGDTWSFTSQAKYSITYDTSTHQTLKEVKIVFKRIESDDHGDFRVYYTRGSSPTFLYFHLSPKGPPQCPTNVTILGKGHSEAAISWIPGANNGSPQTFVLTRYSNSSTNRNETYEKEEPANHVNGGAMMFNLTDLHPSTEYFIKVEARNELGFRKCPEVTMATITTLAQSLSDSDNSTTTVIGVVVSIVLIAIIAVIVIIVFIRIRRKRKYRSLEKRSTANSVSYASPSFNSTGSSQQGSVRLARRTTADCHDDEQASAHYAECSHVNTVRSNEDDDYYHDGVKDNVYNNVTAMEDVLYANTKACQESLANEMPPTDSNHGSEYNRNEDGLIYVEVVINPIDGRPTIKSAENPAAPQHHEETVGDVKDEEALEREEAVEYTTVDFLATAEMRRGSEMGKIPEKE